MNNLYDFSHNILSCLYTGLKQPFKLSVDGHIEGSSIHKALREAVINMIIHSDFTIPGVLKVTKNDIGFSFSNPGSLKIPIGQIYQRENSTARNPRIQTMFRMIGLGDNPKSGFSQILEAWKEEGWRMPDLKENHALNQVELNLYTLPYKSEESEKFLIDLFGDHYLELDDLLKDILRTALFENTVTVDRVNLLFNVDRLAAKEALESLTQNGFLTKTASPYTQNYFLNREYCSLQSPIFLIL